MKKIENSLSQCLDVVRVGAFRDLIVQLRIFNRVTLKQT